MGDSGKQKRIPSYLIYLLNVNKTCFSGVSNFFKIPFGIGYTRTEIMFFSIEDIEKLASSSIQCETFTPFVSKI